MNAATPHFVRYSIMYPLILHWSTVLYDRCLKPNSCKLANSFTPDYVLSQLKYTGVLETTRIRRQGYSIRMTFEEFLEKYGTKCNKLTLWVLLNSQISFSVICLRAAGGKTSSPSTMLTCTREMPSYKLAGIYSLVVCVMCNVYHALARPN